MGEPCSQTQTGKGWSPSFAFLCPSAHASLKCAHSTKPMTVSQSDRPGSVIEKWRGKSGCDFLFYLVICRCDAEKETNSCRKMIIRNVVRGQRPILRVCSIIQSANGWPRKQAPHGRMHTPKNERLKLNLTHYNSDEEEEEENEKERPGRRSEKLHRTEVQSLWQLDPRPSIHKSIPSFIYVPPCLYILWVLAKTCPSLKFSCMFDIDVTRRLVRPSRVSYLNLRLESDETRIRRVSGIQTTTYASVKGARRHDQVIQNTLNLGHQIGDGGLLRLGGT